MDTTQKEEQVSLTLLVNKETSNVILAEAGKDFVDVLLSFLTFPLATIARLVSKESGMESVQVGCISSLYVSLSNLDEKYIFKEMLLRPGNSSEDYCRHLKLNIHDTEPNQLKKPFTFLDSSKTNGHICQGFVKGSETFIITDDLIVMPTSLDTTFDMLLKSGTKTMSLVQKETVDITKEKVLDLLKCSLLSKSTLTDLFLKKKPFLEWYSFSPCGVPNDSSMSIKTEVKVVTRRTDGRVLFAQAEHEFVEFIISFLKLSLGRVTSMLGGNSSLGCIDGLYKSVVDLDEKKYLISEEVKKILVKADPAQQFTFRNNRFGGGVMASVFNITDELVVVPVSQVSAVSLLLSLEIPLSDLKEQIVTIGAKEGLSILKASLTSKSALTNGLAHLITEAE